jgi:RNA polymerase sigma-70 factor (ECF subfamily)
MSRLGRAEVDELFARYGAIVYRRALVLLGNPADAEDATQEVFVRALTNLHKYEGRSQLTTWMYRITTNYCLNVLRSKRTRTRILDDDYQHPPALKTVTPMSDVVTIRKLLAEADEKQAMAAVFVFVDGMSRAEAAAALECSERTVTNLLSRFKAWAREGEQRDE